MLRSLGAFGLCAALLAGCATTAVRPSSSAERAWVAWSQHAGQDGRLWWRKETDALSAEDCRATLKRVTTRPAVGFTKWYDVTPTQLEKALGQAATPDRGTWLACWPLPLDFNRDLAEL